MLRLSRVESLTVDRLNCFLNKLSGNELGAANELYSYVVVLKSPGIRPRLLAPRAHVIPMAEAFDAYHVWLGIPPEEQPPHHYRLLGLQLFESNPDAISNALDQRRTHLRSLQVGKRAALSQQLLNEVSAAGVCLLDNATKKSYDAQLKTKLQAARAHASQAARKAAALPVARPLPAASPPPQTPVDATAMLPPAASPAMPTPAGVESGGPAAIRFSPAPAKRRASHPIALLVPVV